MEELGIGRPSTYAKIIDTIKERGYVTLEEKKFKPTEIGIETTDKLQEFFSDLINVKYTAEMEYDLDEVAEGLKVWNKVLAEFYKLFEPRVKNAFSDMEKKAPEETGEKCPECGNILSSTISYKYSGTPNKKEYYHLTCKNVNCKLKGLHYSSDKIEKKLGRVLNELTRYMYDMNNEIIVSNSTKSKDISDIDKAIEKLKIQEKKLVDLYLSSNLNVDAINHKNEVIKKEIEKLNKKKQLLDPNDDFKEYTVELLKKLDYKKEEDYLLFNKLGFSFMWDSLNRKAKRDILNKLVSQIEITRDKNYNIEIKNIKFTDEFISRSCKEYLEYLNDIQKNINIGIKYQELITTDELNDYSKNYYVLSLQKLEKNEYSNDERKILLTLASEHFYYDGIIQCPLYSNETIIDQIMLIPKTEIC